MQLDKEKELKQEQERCRMLARQIARELAPRTVRLTAEYDLLEAALKEEKFVFAPEEEAAELLIVTDPEQADLTGLESETILLAGRHAEEVAAAAQQRDQRCGHHQAGGGRHQPPTVRSGRLLLLGRFGHSGHDAVCEAGGGQRLRCQRFAQVLIKFIELGDHRCPSSPADLTGAAAERFPAPDKISFRRALARLMRDFTVPSLTASAAAISL